MKIHLGDIIRDIGYSKNNIGLVVRIDGYKIWCRWGNTIEEVKNSSSYELLWIDEKYTQVLVGRNVKVYPIVDWLKKYTKL